MATDAQKPATASAKFMAMLSPGARVALVVLTILLMAAVFAPWVAPYGENEIVGEFWEPFSERSWLGTDQLGRDLLTRLIYGAQNTFLIAGAATLLSFTMGSFLGILAAVSRGVVDQLLSRLNDMMMAIPTLIFALVILSVMPSNLIVLILVMGILDSTRVFRLSRAVAVDIAVFDFVEVARLRGERTFWIISREIVANALAPECE